LGRLVSKEGLQEGWICLKNFEQEDWIAAMLLGRKVSKEGLDLVMCIPLRLCLVKPKN